jgi:hypothetical protein
VILDLLWTLIIVALVAVLALGMLAPLESLRWWSGGAGESTASEPEDTAEALTPEGPLPDPVIIYLSGIGSISGDELLDEEARFLDQLAPLIPGGVIVRNVFPYSVAGVGLTGARVFARFWQALDRMRMRGDMLLSSLINVRNVFQVAVAADPRYGSIFSYGVAQIIAREARKAGFRDAAGQRLVILGYSGGAQVAVGTAPFLRQLMGVNVRVISLGGVLDSDPGMRVVARMDHLVGDRDVMEQIGRVVYPGRWPVARTSAWNVARREGVLNVRHLPGMAHNTPGGYMDPSAHSSDGALNPEITARAIVEALSATTVQRGETQT